MANFLASSLNWVDGMQGEVGCPLCAAPMTLDSLYQFAPKAADRLQISQSEIAIRQNASFRFCSWGCESGQVGLMDMDALPCLIAKKAAACRSADQLCISVLLKQVLSADCVANPTQAVTCTQDAFNTAVVCSSAHRAFV